MTRSEAARRARAAFGDEGAVALVSGTWWPVHAFTLAHELTKLAGTRASTETIDAIERLRSPVPAGFVAWCVTDGPRPRVVPVLPDARKEKSDVQQQAN